MTDRGEPRGEIKPGQVMPLSAVSYDAVFLLTSSSNLGVQGKSYRRADNGVTIPFGFLREVKAVKDELTGAIHYEDIHVDKKNLTNSVLALVDYDVTIVSPSGAEYEEGLS